MTTTASVDKQAHSAKTPDANLGYEYLVSWYIGQISADAVGFCLPSYHLIIHVSGFQIPEKGTGMPDEINYVSYLFDYDTAMKKLYGSELDVLRYAWAVYTHTMEVENASVKDELAEASGRQKENNQVTV